MENYLCKEQYVFKKESRFLRGFISHSDSCNEFMCGEAWVEIVFDDSGRYFAVNLKDIEVPRQILRKGFGTDIMRNIFNTVYEIKKTFSINETIRICGWLSLSDKEKGNWRRAVPFYEKIGRISGIAVQFLIRDSKEVVNTKEEFFSKVGDSEAEVFFYI